LPAREAENDEEDRTMNATCSLRYRWVFRALAIGSLGLIVVVLLGEAAGEKAKDPAEGKTAKRDAKAAVKMVEAIANRNKPPKIVRRRQVCPQEFPLFSKNYDWKEEKRVHKALAPLKRDTSAELWEALVQKATNRRYCIVSYSGSSADAYIFSVGDICTDLAYSRLCGVFEKHLPSLPPHGCPIQFWNIKEDMAAWRKDRKDKALYQLQIEVCEMALREVPKMRTDDVSDKEKAEARKKIEAEVAKLRRTKQPALAEPGSGFIPAYPRGEAERVRQAYEKGVLEEFRSGLNK
jgi:hypothetical protein